MPTYFKQIIFSPLPKSPHIEQKFGIDNKPMLLMAACISESVDFWFVDVTVLATRETKIQLMAACPVCDTAFVIRRSIQNREIMRHALKENGKFYRSYVIDHCPKCFPGNRVMEKEFVGD